MTGCATYYAQTANLDTNLGRLMQALEASGVADDTILVFTSDHGEMFGAHGRQAKLIFYEEAARVPFLVRWPKKIAEKTVTDVPLCTPDIMPTLLSMMDLPVPQDGRRSGPECGTCWARSRTVKDTAHMQGMGATAAWADGSEWRALRDHEYTYAIYRKDRSELLFNNRKRPIPDGEPRGRSVLPDHSAALPHSFRDVAQAAGRHLRSLQLV